MKIDFDDDRSNSMAHPQFEACRLKPRPGFVAPSGIRPTMREHLLAVSSASEASAPLTARVIPGSGERDRGREGERSQRRVAHIRIGGDTLGWSMHYGFFEILKRLGNDVWSSVSDMTPERSYKLKSIKARVIRLK